MLMRMSVSGDSGQGLGGSCDLVYEKVCISYLVGRDCIWDWAAFFAYPLTVFATVEPSHLHLATINSIVPSRLGAPGRKGMILW